MKKLLLLCLLIFSLKSFSQTTTPSVDLPLKDGVVTYQNVVEVSGKDAGDIYSRVLDWYLKEFPGENNDLVTNDVSIGQLMGKSKFSIVLKGTFGISTTYYINVNVTVDCKDGKYRYRFENFKSTLEGKSESDLFSKYLVNVPIETDLALANGTQKGSKSQIKLANQRIAAIDAEVNGFISRLRNTVNKKAADF